MTFNREAMFFSWCPAAAGTVHQLLLNKKGYGEHFNV
jgi:hypothetical protein